MQVRESGRTLTCSSRPDGATCVGVRLLNKLENRCATAYVSARRESDSRKEWTVRGTATDRRTSLELRSSKGRRGQRARRAAQSFGGKARFGRRHPKAKPWWPLTRARNKGPPSLCQDLTAAMTMPLSCSPLQRFNFSLPRHVFTIGITAYKVELRTYVSSLRGGILICRAMIAMWRKIRTSQQQLISSPLKL